jgi:hypothetical protein
MPWVALVAVVLADQGTKFFARRRLPRDAGASARRLAWREVRPRWLEQVGPAGAAALLILGAGAVAVGSAGPLQTWAVAGAAAALGAAASNLFDFARRGAVVDFIWLPPDARWNLADLAIVGGVAVVVGGVAA